MIVNNNLIRSLFRFVEFFFYVIEILLLYWNNEDKWNDCKVYWILIFLFRLNDYKSVYKSFFKENNGK